MRFTPVFFCLLFIGAGLTTPKAKTPDSVTSAFIYSVQSKLFNDRFSSAESLCNFFIEAHPDHPAGYLFKCGVLLGEMSDAEEPDASLELRNLIDSLIAICERGINSCSRSDSAYFYLWKGHAHVYRSLFESRFGSFTQAIKHGFRAHDNYRKGLECDSTLYDLYFGLGNYHYWKSVKAGLLRSLGLVGNEINKGIEEIKKAADSGQYFSEAAKNSMIWIWLERQEYDSVVIAGSQMLSKYPDSRTLRWPLAAAFFKKGNTEKSLEFYQYLLEYFEKNRGNYFNLIECDYQLYECYKKMDREVEAEIILNRVGAYRSTIPKKTLRRQLAKLNYLRRELAR